MAGTWASRESPKCPSQILKQISGLYFLHGLEERYVAFQELTGMSPRADGVDQRFHRFF
jgi:hypothetical protein